MIKIRRGNETLNVTVGAFKNFFKGDGWQKEEAEVEIFEDENLEEDDEDLDEEEDELEEEDSETEITLEDMTKAGLRAYAEEHNVDLAGVADKKKALIAAIENTFEGEE